MFRNAVLRRSTNTQERTNTQKQLVELNELINDSTNTLAELTDKFMGTAEEFIDEVTDSIELPEWPTNNKNSKPVSTDSTSLVTTFFKLPTSKFTASEAAVVSSASQLTQEQRNFLNKFCPNTGHKIKSEKDFAEMNAAKDRMHIEGISTTYGFIPSTPQEVNQDEFLKLLKNKQLVAAELIISAGLIDLNRENREIKGWLLEITGTLLDGAIFKQCPHESIELLLQYKAPVFL